MSNETVKNEDRHYKVRVSDEGTFSVDEVADVVKTDEPVVTNHRFGPVSHDDDENYTIQGERRIDLYLETVAEMLGYTMGLNYETWEAAFDKRCEDEDFVDFYHHSGAIKYWERGILNDFLKHLHGYPVEGEHK